MIDLRSDTVTKPDEAMREAAATAEVGDDVHRGDPTVQELESRAAAALGKEAGLFVPSGTMGNQIAAAVHTEPGQEVLAETESHVVRYELGGFAQLSGLQVRMLDAGPRGIPSPATIRDEFVEESLHRPGTGLLCLENTHNVRGGLAISPDAIEAAATAAHDLDVPVHLDGARVFNAAVALDVPVTEIVNHVDSVMFCLSKGLGAPIGSVLVGADTFIERARRVRKLFGGGMRQVGIIAAPGLHALDNVDDLETDHEHARILADALTSIDGFAVSSPETNIILVEVSETGLDAAAVCGRLQSQGVGASTVGATTVRFCTHRDVDRSDIDEAIERISQVMS